MTDVYHIDEIWSLDILDLKEYGPENNRCFKCVSAVIDNLLKFSWKIPLKNKIAQTIKDSFENILINSKKNQNYSKPIEVTIFVTNFLINL